MLFIILINIDYDKVLKENEFDEFMFAFCLLISFFIISFLAYKDDQKENKPQKENKHTYNNLNNTSCFNYPRQKQYTYIRSSNYQYQNQSQI